MGLMTAVPGGVVGLMTAGPGGVVGLMTACTAHVLQASLRDLFQSRRLEERVGMETAREEEEMQLSQKQIEEVYTMCT